MPSSKFNGPSSNGIFYNQHSFSILINGSQQENIYMELG